MNNNYIKVVDSPDKKTSDLMNEMRSLFKVWSYYDDKELDNQFSPPKETSTRYFLKTQEADPDLANRSAEDLEKENIPCITLRERLIMEVEYYKETGKNLDIGNITLCAGSRYADGFVPSVSRSYGGVVYVNGYGPQLRSAYLRARRAVSLNPSPTSSLDSEPPYTEQRIARLEEDMKKLKEIINI